MTAPQTSTHLSAQVQILVSSLCLSDLPRVLVRFVIIHLSIPARGRPAAMPNSNAIPIAPRHPFTLSPAPGRPSPPAAQPFHNSQPFGPSVSPKIPLKPSHAMIPPDNGHPPRQPRSDVAPQAVASPSSGPSMISKTYSQYPRHRAYFASCN
jgi:hypothetical protein